ncbi:hypothetical protein [Mesosutterella porci]|nr:hypothetical protein [Mesosutterella sp. oilRF-744-WT-GAM-9]
MEGEMVFWLAVSAAAVAGAAAFLALRAAGILRGAAGAEAHRPSRGRKPAGRPAGRAAREGSAPSRAPVPVFAASPVLIGFRAPGCGLPFLLVSPVRDCERRFFLETPVAFPAFEVPFAAALRLPGAPGSSGGSPVLFELAADPLQSSQLSEAALPEALGYGSGGLPMGCARGLGERLAYDAAGALLALSRAPWKPLALRRASQLSREALSSGAQASGEVSCVLRGLADPARPEAGVFFPAAPAFEGPGSLLQAINALERSLVEGSGADFPEPLLRPLPSLLDAALHALSDRPRFAVRLDAAGRALALYRFDASAGEGGDFP